MRAYCDLAGGQLHYRHNNAQQSSPLLLLHQSPSDSAMYERLMDALKRFLVDCPGQSRLWLQ